MTNTELICKKCGAELKQKGSLRDQVLYECPFCGHSEYVTLTNESNSDYWINRNLLMGRVRAGVTDHMGTNWDLLLKDITHFMMNHEASQFDIYFKVGILACMTRGFHNLDGQNYNECKRIFKGTEKVYKKYRKDPIAKEHFSKETGDAGITEYEEYRHLYKKCLYDFRSEQVAWKLLFTVGKKLIPFGKFF